MLCVLLPGVTLRVDYIQQKKHCRARQSPLCAPASGLPALVPLDFSITCMRGAIYTCMRGAIYLKKALARFLFMRAHLLTDGPCRSTFRWVAALPASPLPFAFPHGPWTRKQPCETAGVTAWSSLLCASQLQETSLLEGSLCLAWSLSFLA